MCQNSAHCATCPPQVEDEDISTFLDRLVQHLNALFHPSVPETTDPSTCCLCDREMPMTWHHVIPKDVHKKFLKKGYTKQELARTIPLCRMCHSAVHMFFTNEELGVSYNTPEKLLEVSG